MKKRANASFGDIDPVMQAALSSPEGVRYRLATYGLAVNFRQRFYMYKKGLRKLAADRMGLVPGAEASVPADGLTLAIENMNGERIPPGAKNAGRKGPHDVVITHRAMDGELLTMSGEPISLDEVEEDFELPDIEEALRGLDLEEGE